MQWLIRTILAATSLVTLLLLSPVLFAQDDTPEVLSATAAANFMENAKTKVRSSINKGWDVSADGVMTILPTLGGSDRYIVLPVPLYQRDLMMTLFRSA